MRLIVQDNLWFTGAPTYANYEIDGQTMIPVAPLLGRTDSSDLAVKLQELQWLLRYTGRTGSGLVIAQEWIKPGDLIDRNLGPWIELFARHAGRARWILFYDPVLAVRQRGLGRAPIDFSRPEVRELWESDLDYLAREYFSADRYWHRGGKPVLYVWAVHGLRNFHDAFASAAARGVYLLGDVLGSDVDPGPISAATGFVAALPGREPGDRGYDEFLDDLAGELGTWSRRAAESGLDFIPAASLQYDDTEFQSALGPDQSRPPTRIVARERADLTRLLLLLSAHAPAEAIFLGTANNWAEGTTCLPTVRPGRRYRPPRIGSYFFDHLETVRETLFPGVDPYDGPALVERPPRGGRVRRELLDADFAGQVRVRGEAELVTGRNCRRSLVGDPLRVTVRNRDGRKLRWERAEAPAAPPAAPRP